MKPLFFVALCALALPAGAVDHDNIDAGRPLDFDDAETIAFRERAFEFGAALDASGKVGVEGEAEFLVGFAKNWHASVGIDPSLASQNGDDREFDVGDVELSVQHNFNRETESTPAFGLRADAFFSTGRDSSGVDFRLRGIVSRGAGRYGRLHLNADLGVNNSPRDGERRTQPGVIVGYSQPLGFPTRFNRTLVAQVGYRAAPEKNENGILNVGIGLRQQVTPRSVFDIGVTSDLAGGGDEREKLRLIAGYSTAF